MRSICSDASCVNVLPALTIILFQVVPTTLEFVDVAGLVKGASAGEGLGNQFLATIRQCDAVVHVVRCFEDENVIHVDGSVDPVRDAELINLELALSDLSSVEKRLERMRKDRKSGNANEDEGTALEKIAVVLNNGEPARNAVLDDAEEKVIKSFGLYPDTQPFSGERNNILKLTLRLRSHAKL